MKVWANRTPVTYRWLSRLFKWSSRRKGLPIRPEDYLAVYAPGRSLADIGGMWGINGDHSFTAEQVGASRVVLVDMYRTEEFERRRVEQRSQVEFVSADASAPDLRSKVGLVDVVWCFGVLYHHPAPFVLLKNLRSICSQYLILETLVIPEVPGFPQMATYFPFQAGVEKRWSTADKGGAGLQIGINRPFDTQNMYINNFWGMSPSCVSALLQTAGFKVHLSRRIARSPMRQVFVAQAAEGGALRK